MVSPEGLSMDPAKTKVVQEWPVPRTVKEVQSFLSFANFYWHFISQYSAIVKLLTNLTGRMFPSWWQTSALLHLKSSKRYSQLLLSSYISNMSSRLLWRLMPSDYAITAVILQEDPTTKMLHPIAFYSCSMSPAELNYEIYDKELLVIFAAFKEWRAYMEGSTHPIQVITNHKNLEPVWMNFCF